MSYILYRRPRPAAELRTGTTLTRTPGYALPNHTSTSARDPSRQSISLPELSRTNAQ